MNQEVVAIPTEAWIQEQCNVASQVIVLPDPKSLPFVFVPKYTSADEEVDDTVAPMQSVPRFVDMVVTDEYDQPTTNPCYYYGGVDVSFPEPGRHDNDHAAVAVYVILEYPSFQVVYQEYIYFPLTVPYIPSFLAFREIEPIQSLIQQQLISHPQYTPTAILVDGNGIFHPRYAGLACFVGVRTGIPTIGIGKTLYCDTKMGRTKETMHRTIYNSIRNCCWCGRASSIGDDNRCCSDTQSRPSPTPNDRQVKQNHSSACIVTFDCHVETSPLLIHDDHSEDDDVNHSRYRPLTAEGSSTTTTVTTTLEERTHYMMELSQTKCIGLAIPIGGMIRPHDMIQNRTNHHENNITNMINDDTTVSILAYALVGHGGRIRDRTTPKYQRNGPQKTTNPTLSSQHSFRCPRTIPGTSNPIYISVGHAISLQDAVLICARLSLSRIPEPVRLADLHGRAVLRDGHPHHKEGPNQTKHETSQFTRKK